MENQKQQTTKAPKIEAVKYKELTPKARAYFAHIANVETQRLRQLLAQWLGIKEARAYYLHAWPIYQTQGAGGFKGVSFQVLTRADLFDKEKKDRERLEEVREFVQTVQVLGYEKAAAMMKRSGGDVLAIKKGEGFEALEEEGQDLDEPEEGEDSEG